MANRYRDQYGANEIPMEAADSGFLGVNMLLDPGLLKTGAAYRDVNQMLAGPGIAAGAINMRFSRGVAETRAGTVAPTWCNPRNTAVILADSGIVNVIASGSAVLHGDYEGMLAIGGGRVYWLPRLAANVNSKAAYQWKQADGNIANLEYDGAAWVLEYWPDTTAGSGGAVNIATSNPTSAGPEAATWPANVSVFESPWVAPWAEPILAAAPFADPDGVEWLVLAFPSRVVRVRQAEPPRVISLPDGVTLAAPVKLLQTFNSMVMLRGFAATPLAWDGDDGNGFETIPDADPNGSYTRSIPPAKTGAVMNNRLFLPFDRDTVAVSDILNFTRYDAQLNAFRINAGEDDAIQAVFPFRRTNLLVFKEFSTHVITDVTGDLSNVGAEIVNSEIGCPAPDSIAAVGGDVYFLSHNGVFQVSEVVEQSMQVQEMPVSEPIDPLIKRINWNYVHLAAGIVMGDYYRLAVPIDGATRNNAVLVYDTVRGSWQGYDTYPEDFCPDLFTKGKHDGRRRAIAIDQQRATVAVLDIGTTDAFAVAVTDTNATLTTSFAGEDNDFTVTSKTAGTVGNATTLAVAATTTSATTVGVAGTEITVTPGDMTWNQRESNRYWHSVASSANGVKLVAGVSPGYVYTSNDGGATWNQRGVSADWNAITSSIDGTKLAAATPVGIMLSSNSGLTWTATETAESWFWVSGSSDGVKLAAIVSNGQIHTSADSGATWTARESNRAWSGIASSADGVKLVAVVSSGRIYTSTDSGATWTARESSRSWRSVASSADGVKLVATVTNGQIYTSTDSGATWTARESNRAWYGVACSTDGMIIAAMELGGNVHTSTDGGATWTSRLSTGWWYSVAMSSDGSKIIAGPSVVTAGKIYVGTNTTAADIVSAINASSPAFALVNASIATGNDGTGTVGTLTTTNLSGGFNGTGLVFPAVVTENQITSQLTTRGYILLDDGPKRLRHGHVTVETWNPNFTIETLTEGVNEANTALEDRTRDRTKWHVHGKADYVTTNENHDHDAPKRRDYSTPLPAAGLELDTGVRLQLMQESIEQFPIRQHGRWLALRITNTQDRISIKAAGIDGQNIRNQRRVFA